MRPTFASTVCCAALFAAWPSSARTAETAAPAIEAARPLTLRDALEMVGRLDPKVRTANTDVDRARLASLRAQLDRVTISVDGQVQELWNVSSAPVQGTESRYVKQGLFNASAKVTVPLFAGFRISATADRAELLTEAAAQSLLAAERELTLSTVRAYWSVRRLGLLVDVQRQTLARLSDAEEVTAARLNAGLAPAIDHNRAVLRRLQGQDLLADFTGQEREATAELATALGVASDVDLLDEPSFPEGAPASVVALLERAQLGRPELAAARYQRLAQEQAVLVARSAYFPELDLIGLFQYGNNPYVTSIGTNVPASSGVVSPFNNMSGNLTAGLSLSWNVFNMFQTYTATREATYQLTLRLEDERRVARTVESELRVARAKVEHLSARRAALWEAHDVARDNLQILRLRYENGDAMVIEYLDAEVELANTELQLGGLTSELQVAWLELNLAMGVSP